MGAKFGRGPMVVSKKRKGEYRHTDYETFTSMSGTIRPTANNVSNFGGDPVTQLIVNVYQIIV